MFEVVEMKRLIKNGVLVDAQGEYRQDLLIENGVIRARAADIQPDSETEVIDASGCYVMPGGIDVHTHFNIDVGIARSCDDFFSGTRAAACGGTTTIVDHMGFGPAGCNLHHQLARYHDYAADQAVIDYSFHGVIQHVDDAILNEMAAMVQEEGISSFKLYLTYQYKLGDHDVLRALARLKEVGALATVHPENDAAIAARRAALLAAGHHEPWYHPQSRPLECEAEAIARMINLAGLAGNAPLYIVHLSNGLGLEYLKLARRQGQPVWVETCPQYLLLDDSCYYRENGVDYLLSPPLRSRREQDKLWVGIAAGDIDTVATDHCNFSHAQRILFGLWPRKGNLQAGSDADLVLMDPRGETLIRHAALHDNGDYSPYEGMHCPGQIRMTLSRGEIVARDGEFLGRRGHGRFLARAPFDPALAPELHSSCPAVAG